MTGQSSAGKRESPLKPVFAHLHVHTEYSIPDGACRIRQTLELAKEMAMSSLAITDHGGLYGAVELYETVAEWHWDMKSIIGTEICVSASPEGQGLTSYHLVLLARDNKGYENLVRLVSLSYEDGRYANPFVTKSDLEEHARGLIALSGCARGEVPSLLTEGQEREAREAAAGYARIFGENDFYLELMDQGLCGQAELNAMMIDLAGSVGLPVVATNNAHYMRASDAKAHSILVGLRNGDSEEHPGGEFYLKSPEEMESLFANSPEAIGNTEEIAYRCDVELPLGRFHKPGYLPTGTGDAAAHLRREAEEGLGEKKGSLPEGAGERLEKELELIEHLGLSGYFLLVADVVRFARQAGISISARGSSSASLVNFALGVTSVDPVTFDLPYERFLHCDTGRTPHFDFDVSTRRRGELVEYVVQKHGNDKVAQIISFSRIRARAASREACRCLGLDQCITGKLLEQLQGYPYVTRAWLENGLKSLCDEDSNISEAVYLPGCLFKSALSR